MTDIQQDGRARRQQDIFDLNRTKLIDTAVDVINEVGDIREVTLTQIAKEAGVSPATAYNHFPDRMEDVFSAIVHSRMDVAANMGATLADESLSVIEKLKQIPVTYAENLVSLGYAGKVIVVQMFNLVNVNKWLDQDPVQAITALLSNSEEYQDRADEIAVNMATHFYSRCHPIPKYVQYCLWPMGPEGAWGCGIAFTIITMG